MVWGQHGKAVPRGRGGAAQVKGIECCVMAGDPKQLPPTVRSTRAAGMGLGDTLFARLAESAPARRPLRKAPPCFLVEEACTGHLPLGWKQVRGALPRPAVSAESSPVQDLAGGGCPGRTRCAGAPPWLEWRVWAPAHLA